jgi:hypothetical protein
MSIENALERLNGELEQDRSLNELWHLRQRVEALDQLDVYLSVGQASGSALRHRTSSIYTKFESVNSRLYEASVEIFSGAPVGVGCVSGCPIGTVQPIS